MVHGNNNVNINSIAISLQNRTHNPSTEGFESRKRGAILAGVKPENYRDHIFNPQPTLAGPNPNPPAPKAPKGPERSILIGGPRDKAPSKKDITRPGSSQDKRLPSVKPKAIPGEDTAKPKEDSSLDAWIGSPSDTGSRPLAKTAN